MDSILGRVIIFAVVSGSLLGCSNVHFSPVEKYPSDETVLSEKEQFFPLGYSEISFSQPPSLENEVTILTQVGQQGRDVATLKATDFVLKEKGKEISDFGFSRESSKKDQVVDIVFIVDITGTMTSFIETAKMRLSRFIQSARGQGFHTRMCLSSFGDYTVKKCQRFYDNDPNDDGTLVQTDELISELTKLRAYKGAGQDPGWPDMDENPMRALIDAAKDAPWRSDAQKFIILVTDAGFLYAPENPGHIESTRGILPPTMTEVATVLRESQAVVFGVTPDLAGYNKPFKGFPGIVAASGGEHFLFSDLISGKSSLDQVLARIIDRINSTYRLAYVVDRYEDLDPTLPLKERKISLQMKSEAIAQIRDVKLSATFANGRPRYQQAWSVFGQGGVGEVEVSINDQVVNTDGFSVANEQIIFKTPPAAGAIIKIKYLHRDLFENLKIKPIFLEKMAKESDLKVYLNGRIARANDVLVERALNGQLSVTILPAALKDDYFEVIKHGGLAVLIQ